jgi:hypothetical protein
MSFTANILKIIKVSPGLKTLNNAGSAIKSENKGMNTQVLFKKNKRPIREKRTKIRHSIYKYEIRYTFFRRMTKIIKERIVSVFIRGSIDCRRPSLDA